MMELLSIENLDEAYQYFRSSTTTGLSLIAAGNGAIKGIMSFEKIARML